MSTKKCEICGRCIYVGQNDIVLGIKHTRGWAMKMVCSRCLSNRGEFMREYRKLVDKLVGITKKKASKWWKKSEFISVGNGVHRLRKQDCSIEIDETNRMIVADTD